jgi:gamma-glutamyl hercynylcysteine S-oxide synthase
VELKAHIARGLEESRRRSLDLLDPLSEADQIAQHSPIMSPLIWDLAHIGNYEELWLVRNVAGDPPTSAQYDDMYDAFEHPRASRPALPLLGPAEARRYIAGVRGRALDLLDAVDLDPAQPLLDHGFVYGMVIQHEQQHDETMLATLQLMDGNGHGLLAPRPPTGRGVEVSEILVAGGPFTMGTDEPWAYDNERPAHTVDVAPFWIDTIPVTNAAVVEFVEDGGYAEPALWDRAGWKWRQEESVEHPQFWQREGQRSWSRRRFGAVEALPLDEPVQHVSWYEADAFARWAGKRLPTEAEWEKAASWTPDGRKRRWPWGDQPPGTDHANLGQRHLQPAPAGAYPRGVSPWGCHEMAGDVWEWTSSYFQPYPGFASFPYREYSEVFWGDEYRVLRGGSWATHPSVMRTTFRNWDYPIRRQIFAGFRCARDET